MEERQVSVDGVTHALPEPFFVVATQNPHEQLGTYALPESQLDRFLMRIELGYPDARGTSALLLARATAASCCERIAPVLTPAELLAAAARGARRARRRRRCSTTCRRWWRTRARATCASACRRAPRRAWCAPPAPGRCSTDARAVLPDDVQAVLPAVAAHRLERRDAADHSRRRRDWLRELIAAVPVPV